MNLEIPLAYGFRTWDLFALRQATRIGLADSIPFEKRSLLSRMQIRSASGPLTLSIPVKKWSRGTPLAEIRIDYLQKWKHQHRTAIRSAYGKAPYFVYLKEELDAFYDDSPVFLTGFTRPFLHWLLGQFLPLIPRYDSLTQTRVALQPFAPNFLSGTQSLTAPSFRNYAYTQVFGGEFAEGLSALDLLFCDGPKFWNLQN
jgi:hypothetical protein